MTLGIYYPTVNGWMIDVWFKGMSWEREIDLVLFLNDSVSDNALCCKQ